MSVRTTGPISVEIGNQCGDICGTKVQTMIQCPMQIAKNTLDYHVMRFPRIMHMKKNLLNNIRNVRPSERRDVLQCFDQSSIVSRTSNKWTLYTIKLATRVDGSGTWLTICHTRTLKNLNDIPPLRNMKSIRLSRNHETKKMVQRVKICHRKCVL